MGQDIQNCRSCNKELNGRYPYAYDPVSKKDAKWNYYGGFVCSYICDYNACLDLERSMPGHGYSQKKVGQSAMNKIRQNWPNES